ncbi:DNA replication/repair protein RecF [Rhodobium gokarnense]|uniref:DNA replication and repair protein RecF n=1 Tax=Rhodobium gokarnense TaxID=364296 RepID=A0ABT3HI26_9HYPH|nr:DNA replication/repair protein RecF [Rhodobium gokarnense]MCW2310060.1 DNA replication and repair protein RecF [Rhodobium gokarnense]
MTSPGALSVTALKLTDFRNYARLSLTPDGRHVVLCGENGAGKTNILEALSYLSPGRGLRRARLEDVSRQGGAGGWAVAATLLGAAGETVVGTGLVADGPDPERQRRIRIDGTTARSSEELLDVARVLWLTPAMDGLFTGPAGDRRRFLDRLVLAIDRDHARRVSSFEKAMRERNKVLEEGGRSSWLDGLEAQMAEYAVAVAAARAELAACFSRLISAHHDPESPFPDAALTLDGELEREVSGRPAVEVEDSYRETLAAARPRDRTAGRALTGPHRSDLLVRHGPKDMAAETCSTGEQKALLLGLVLAHARLVEEMTGRTPLLLLDEVAAHLDSHRRAGLFAALDRLGVQAWMTGTDLSLFAALEDRAQRFAVQDGTVSDAA